MRGPQILVLVSVFAAGVLGFVLVLEWGDLPLLPGGRYTDPRAQLRRAQPKTAQEAEDRQREAERILGQAALQQLQDLAHTLPALDLPAHDRTPRNLQDLVREAPELAEQFVEANGLKEIRGCRHDFRSFVETRFKPEAVIRSHGWNREALRKFWHKLHFADCTHESE